MSPELYLIAPTDQPAERLKSALAAAVAEHDVAALLLPRGALSENAYKALAKAIVPLAQQHGAAALVEGDPGLVRLLGADGLHVQGGIEATRQAIAALKPDFIVGVGDVQSRDDAMSLGELGIDYILFGPLSGVMSADARDTARWWAETMEIPSVLSDPEATDASSTAEGCEFIGLPLVLTEPAA